LSTVGHLKRSELNEKVAGIAGHDPEEHLRVAATAAVKQLKQR
jgi:hypothetical protein